MVETEQCLSGYLEGVRSYIFIEEGTAAGPPSLEAGGEGGRWGHVNLYRWFKRGWDEIGGGGFVLQ